MPLKKYANDEERYKALREYRRNYYLKKKKDEEYKKYIKDQHKRYYENNREKCIISVKKCKEKRKEIDKERKINYNKDSIICK